MRNRLSFSGRAPVKHAKRRSRRAVLCKCSLLLAITVLHIPLAGCAGPEKAANKPTGTPPTVRAPVAESPADSPGVQKTLPRTAAEPVMAGAGAEVHKANQGPKITFEKTVHDYGQVSPRSKNTSEFTFKNTGAGVLTVGRKIGSTCGCTVSTLDKTDYGPGEQGVIRVTYTAGAIATTASKILTVYSNDRENPQTRLTITAKVTPQVVCEPKQLNLALDGNVESCPPIKLRSLDGTAFSVTRMLCTGNCLTAEIDPSVRATEFTIQPRPNVEKLQGLPSGHLVLMLTHPECKQVRIAYRALSRFQFIPTALMVVNAEPNIPAQRIVQLSNNYAEDFDIASFSSERNLVKVLDKTKLSSGERSGGRYSLTVSITPPMRTGNQRIFTDTLFVQLTNGRTLKLDCRGIYASTQAATHYPPP